MGSIVQQSLYINFIFLQENYVYAGTYIMKSGL